MNKKEFIQIFTPMSEIFSKEFSELATKMYYTILKDLTYEEFSKASQEVLRNRKYSNFPTPAEFLQAIKGSKEDNTQIEIETALSKFKLMLKKACSIKIDDLKIAWTIKRLGGWDYCLNYNLKNIEWLYKEFSEVYKNVMKLETPAEIENLVLTSRDQNNKNQGLFFPVSKVGDELKIKMLEENKGESNETIHKRLKSITL